MKKISIIALLVFTFAVVNSHAQTALAFFTAKEGLPTATALAEQNIVNPKLVNIITLNGTFPFGTLMIKGEFVYEGVKIGKANIWVYTFVPEEDPSPVMAYQIAMICSDISGELIFIPANTNIDFTEYEVNFRYDKYIDTTTLLNSDAFATALEENELFYNFQSILDNQPECISAIGVATFESDFYGIKSDKISWIRFLQDAMVTPEGIETLWCQTDFDNVNNLTCDKYESILEDYSESNIDIFPAPTKDFINIYNPSDEIINSIAIYDVAGNILFDFVYNTDIIDVSALATGNYFISFNVGNRKIFRSLVINK